MVQLLWGEVPCQLDQHVMNVLNNDLVFPILTGPDHVQVLHAQHFFFDTEPHNSVQFLNVLCLVEVVSEDDAQYIVLLDPSLCVCVCVNISLKKNIL